MSRHCRRHLCINLYLKNFQYSTVYSRRFLSNKTHYTVLNVEPNASIKEIRDAYIKLSKEYHPDSNQNRSNSHEQFISIKKAYDVLSDVRTRWQYDQQLSGGFHQMNRMAKDVHNVQYDRHRKQEGYYRYQKTRTKESYYQKTHGEEFWNDLQQKENDGEFTSTIVLCSFIAVYVIFISVVKEIFKQKSRKFEKTYSNEIEQVIKSDPRYWSCLDKEIINDYINTRSR